MYEEDFLKGYTYNTNDNYNINGEPIIKNNIDFIDENYSLNNNKNPFIREYI